MIGCYASESSGKKPPIGPVFLEFAVIGQKISLFNRFLYDLIVYRKIVWQSIDYTTIIYYNSSDKRP